MDAYRLSVEEALKKYSSSENGLGLEDAQKRLNEDGPNQLEERKKTSPFSLLFKQFLNPLVLILIGAVALKFSLESYLEANVILATVLLMVIVAFIQEAKAEASIESLKKLSTAQSRVKRNGEIKMIPSEEVVVGDVIVLESGDRVSADARILKCSQLQVNESSLTGESAPAEKHSDMIDNDVGLADRKNSVYTGTIITKGKALAVVTASGMQTQLGKIAKQLESKGSGKTPLQKGINRLANGMLLVVLLFIGISTFFGWKAGMSWMDLLLLDISIAVAAIPEGLPGVVTLVLASGVQIMSKKNALIRHLVAVETLGSASVICSDKTGTLTQNQMQMIKYRSFSPPDDLNDLSRECLILCNDAWKSDDKWKGDPLDAAIREWSAQKGILEQEILSQNPRIDEIPFSSENGWMATLNERRGSKRLFVKGIPEKLLRFCSSQIGPSGSEEAIDIAKWEDLAKEMASQGLKVIAICSKDFTNSHLKEENISSDLLCLGLIGLMDPPREDAKEAVEACHLAGIDVVMVTGDHAATARSIASQVGIKDGQTILGRELENLDENKMIEIVTKAKVFARIEPIHKMKIIQAFRAIGRIVAMTGDGVNDAPALKDADIGIAMGLSGTEVAKEASDMILTDDRFATIVDAVEEGRLLFNRLRHVVTFLLATCFGEVFAIILGFVFFQTTPLEPLQILWINLVTGSIIALPLGTEPKVGDELQYPPRDPKVGLIFQGMVWRIITFSAFLGLGAFLIFQYEIKSSGLYEARSAAFCTIITFEWLVSWQIRSDEKPLKLLGFLTNKNLIIANFISLILFLLVLYLPTLERIFQTSPLRLFDWLLCILPGLGIFIFEEARKTLAPKAFSRGKWAKGKTL